jgi:hypothetical protein
LECLQSDLPVLVAQVMAILLPPQVHQRLMDWELQEMVLMQRMSIFWRQPFQIESHY